MDNEDDDILQFCDEQANLEKQALQKAGEFQEEQKYNDDDYGENQNVVKKKVRKPPIRRENSKVVDF